VPHFTTIDALAELSRRFSPFTYALNNPLRYTDPDGMLARPIDDYYDNQTAKYLGSDGASTNNSRLISSFSPLLVCDLRKSLSMPLFGLLTNNTCGSNTPSLPIQNR
jgi:hypothetical protein